MAYKEDELLQLSGLQHFKFCRRQWALIHIEQQWAENFRTTDGALLHENAHNSALSECRGDIRMTRGMYVHSFALGVSGQCDVVEFHRDDDGVPLRGREGRFTPYPIEYKRGGNADKSADALQLCAQAMCLEEMLCCTVAEGALFFGETRRRLPVRFTPELRGEVAALLAEMHQLLRRGHTPKAKPSKACQACSLKELCLPKLTKKRLVCDYLSGAMEDEV